MSIIPAGEIALDRADQELWLPDSCTRSRPTSTTTGVGGAKPGTPATATYACRVSERGVPDAYLRMDAVIGRVPAMITLPHGSDVRRSDVLVVGGVNYTVIGLLAAGAWQTAVRAVCVRVT